jgi:hypothetical protein
MDRWTSPRSIHFSMRHLNPRLSHVWGTEVPPFLSCLPCAPTRPTSASGCFSLRSAPCHGEVTREIFSSGATEAFRLIRRLGGNKTLICSWQAQTPFLLLPFPSRSPCDRSDGAGPSAVCCSAVVSHAKYPQFNNIKPLPAATAATQRRSPQSNPCQFSNLES